MCILYIHCKIYYYIELNVEKFNVHCELLRLLMHINSPCFLPVPSHYFLVMHFDVQKKIGKRYKRVKVNVKARIDCAFSPFSCLFFNSTRFLDFLTSLYFPSETLHEWKITRLCILSRALINNCNNLSWTKLGSKSNKL